MKLFKKREVIDETSCSDTLLKALLSGTQIDRDLAMSIPAVSSAIDKICNTIACVPIKLYKENKNGKKRQIEEVFADTRVSLFNDDPKDTLDGFQFKKALVEDYLLGKGGYAFIEKKRNTVASLRYVEESKITIQKNIDPIFKSYEILVNEETYRPYQFIKILRNTKDGASGKSVVEEVSKAIETAYQTMIYELGLVKKGGNKKGFLISERPLDENSMSVLRSSWKKLYANNEENVLVLNKGLDFKESSNTSVEMQLNERKTTLKDEINSIFHVSNDYNTYIKDAIIPILEAIETALNRDFLLEKEKGSFYFAFDTKELLKGTIKERYEAYKLAVEAGWISKNEIRYKEDYDYVDGLDVISLGLGDVLYDIETKTYYTPNTDSTKKMGENKIAKEVIENENSS